MRYLFFSLSCSRFLSEFHGNWHIDNKQYRYTYFHANQFIECRRWFFGEKQNTTSITDEMLLSLFKQNERIFIFGWEWIYCCSFFFILFFTNNCPLLLNIEQQFENESKNYVAKKMWIFNQRYTHCVVYNCWAVRLKKNSYHTGCAVVVCSLLSDGLPYDGRSHQVMLVQYCV